MTTEKRWELLSKVEGELFWELHSLRQDAAKVEKEIAAVQAELQSLEFYGPNAELAQIASEAQGEFAAVDLRQLERLHLGAL